MGQDKAGTMVGGRTMLERVGSVVSRQVDEVVLLGADRPGWTCWPDAVHASGPLAGVATALSRSQQDTVLLVAVDQPYVTGETLRHLIELEGDLPVVPVDEHGVRQVTCAIYPTSVRDQAFEEANAAGSIQTLLDRISFRPVTPDEWRSWGEDGRSWFSVDTPAAILEAESRFG